MDDYGTSYPQGIFASAGVIQGPQFVGDDFIINSDGYFIYSGTPGAGNLIASSTSAAGADVFGNDYQEGFSVYGTGTSFAQLLDGFVNFQATTSQAGPGYIGNGGAPGLVEISSGQSTGSDTPALIDLLSRVASGAGQEQIIITALETIFNGDITATASNIDIPSGSINLNMAVPTNFPTAGKTLAQTQAAFDALVTSMINRLLIN